MKRKLTNRVLAGFLFLLLLMASTCPFGKVAYAEDVNDPSLSMTGGSARAGASVDIDVDIANNPGIIGATLEINFDSRLTLTGITAGEALQCLDITKPGELVSGCKVHWDAADIEDEDIKDGRVMRLTFNVSDAAVAGDTCFVRIVAVSNGGHTDVYDKNLNPIDLLPASCSVTVEPEPIVAVKGITLDHNTMELYGIGKTDQLVATIKPDDATDKTVMWSSSDETVATVSSKGLVTAVEEGTATITAKTVDGSFAAICAVQVIIPNPKVSMADAEIEIYPAKYVYTGKEVRPQVTVTLNNAELKEGTDYLLFYESNVNTGIATITAVGIGNYSGARATVFQIEKGSQDIVAADKTVAMGKTVKLGANVSSGENLIYETSNPKIAKISATGVVKPVSVGTIAITIRAAETDNYEAGLKTIIVTVKKGANPLVAKAKKASVKYSKVKSKNQVLTVSKVMSVSKAQGKVTYKKISGSKKIVIAKNGKVTIKKGLEKGTYKIKAKICAAGNANYNKKTKTIAFTIDVK